MKIGLAKFKQTISEEVKDKLQTAQASNWLSSKMWDSIAIKGYEQSIKPLFECMEEAQSKQVWIESSTDSPLRDMAHIRFHNLKKIFLAQNGITNMQPLAFMNAPNLSTIILTQNTLTIFKPANKMIFPQLDNFSIESNYIKQIDLSRYKINNLQTFLGFSHVWRFQMISIISFYAKLETINLRRQFVRNNLLFYLPKQKSISIPQTKVVKCLIRKLNLTDKYPLDS